jgi:DNA-binding XRE family transcriptional regulator
MKQPGNNAHWSAKLKYLRQSCDITQEEAARKIGVTQGSYGRWERGEHKPIRPYQTLIANFYNTSREQIFD